jgi:DNA-binding NarL/FixJ family response regulator
MARLRLPRAAFAAYLAAATATADVDFHETDEKSAACVRAATPPLSLPSAPPMVVKPRFVSSTWPPLPWALPGGTASAPPQAFPTLTDREREILKLIARGHPNPSIARELSLSTKTVGNYVSNIFTKLQVADRAQAIIRAREAGLG